ncbi:MAG: hypothetical protein IPP69_03620 [Flavobacteriales bacterium]|nr:hypothetical protein [Flavobacteriales bacterium]
MKKLFIPLLTTLFLFESCCPKCEKCEDCPPLDPELKFTCAELSAVNLISYADALKYVEAAWKDPLCNKNAIKDGMAAFFKTSTVWETLNLTKDSASYEGILFVPAVEETKVGPNLYFSFKSEVLCPGDPNGYRPILAKDKFYRSAINIPAARRREIELPELTPEEFLKSLVIPENSMPKLDNVLVKKLLPDNFSYILSYSDSTGYAEHGYGFIQKDYYKRFLTQDVSGGAEIYGYWVVLGLKKENRTEDMRMVFFPTNDKGEILKGNGVKCLEKSWPPIDPQKK